MIVNIRTQILATIKKFKTADLLVHPELVSKTLTLPQSDANKGGFKWEKHSGAVVEEFLLASNLLGSTYSFSSKMK